MDDPCACTRQRPVYSTSSRFIYASLHIAGPRDITYGHICHPRRAALQSSPVYIHRTNTQHIMHIPGAFTQAAFSFVPIPTRSTTFSGSSPPTSVTVTKLEDRARPFGGAFNIELDDWLRGNEVRWCGVLDAGREKSVAMPSRIGWDTERDLPGDCSIFMCL
jgi:hypothetical protein